MPRYRVVNRTQDSGFRNYTADHNNFVPQRVPACRVYRSEFHAEDAMQDSRAYRQYANDCRRIADTMKNANDKAALLEMAKVWDARAVKAERIEKSKASPS